MTERTAPGPRTLQLEATILRELLRRYRADWERKAASKAVRYVYFIDAHDLDSYINPDNSQSLNGFLLDAECDRKDGSSSYLAELKFKNEEILRRLLFNHGAPIGLLPSHVEEMDDNIAYHSAQYQRKRISLLATAQQEFNNLRTTLGGTLISEKTLGVRASPHAKQEAIKHLVHAAPALMTLLHPLARSPRGRIEDLVQDSMLVALREFPWEEFAIEGNDAEALRQACPPAAAVEAWRDYLDLRQERKYRSNRANRVDAEAIACIEALNALLRKQGHDHVRIVLVTRVMSLLKATILPDKHIEPRAAVFLRHPRMLLMPGADERLSSETVATLAIALHTFQRQLDEQRQVEEVLERARGYFVEAWHSFERAEFALDFRLQAQQGAAHEPSIHQEKLNQLLAWFLSETAFEDIVREQVDASVQEFGYHTYELGQPKDLEPIEGHIEHLDRRTRVRPNVAGVPGPVEFLAASLRTCPSRCESLEDLLGNLDARPEERYLAWALLHACRNRWALAKIYARSAMEAGKLLHSASHPLVLEAMLLLAQVRRLGAETDVEYDDERDPRAEHRYRLQFDEAIRNLHSHRQMSRDARVLQEEAAQVLELNLALGAQSNRGQQLVDGIELLLRAVRLDSDEPLSQARSYAQLLAYALAIHRSRLEWPGGLDPCLSVKEWHGQLERLLSSLRMKLEIDEIPRRLLAMEMIGYVLMEEATDPLATTPSLNAISLRGAVSDEVIPADLRHFAPELHAQISRASDHIARLIGAELERIFGKLKRYREWELLYAPMGSREVEDRVLAQLSDHPSSQEAAKRGFSLMRSCLAASPMGLDPVHRRTYGTAARNFRRAFDGVSNAAVPELAKFHLQMEANYAQLVFALMLSHPAERVKELRSLVQSYEELAKAFPRAAIPRFRLHGICSKLADELAGPDAAEWKARANTELERSADLLESDESMLFEPHHWIKSLVRRRRAAPRFDEARALRRQLRKGERTESVLRAHIAAIQQAFDIVYRQFPEEIDFPRDILASDRFYALERDRRINNVVYSAALFLEVQSDLRRLHPNFPLEQLRHLIEQLHPDGIAEIKIHRRVHTIGLAYRMLGELERAGEAGERLVNLVYHSGTKLQPDVVDILEDAQSWRRDAKPVVLSSSPG